MASTVNPLVVGRVIGEVIDFFVPTVAMTINFSDKCVSNGCNVKPSLAIDAPKVDFSGHPMSLYTLVMIDPDAPSPSDPTMREWVHWLVVDIPGGEDPSKGKELLPYVGPLPPLGIHRFVFVLFQQRASFPPVPPFATRANFSTRYFAAHHGLGLPVATVFFNSKKEPMKTKKKKKKKTTKKNGEGTNDVKKIEA